MAANTVPTTQANTNTQIDNGTLNPDITSNRQVVHITLVCENRTVTPDEVYDALQTLSSSVIAGEKDTFSRGTWIFNIGPS